MVPLNRLHKVCYHLHPIVVQWVAEVLRPRQGDLYQGDFAVIEGVAFEEVLVEDLLAVLGGVGFTGKRFTEGFLTTLPIAVATMLVMILGVATRGTGGLVALVKHHAGAREVMGLSKPYRHMTHVSRTVNNQELLIVAYPKTRGIGS